MSRLHPLFLVAATALSVGCSGSDQGAPTVDTPMSYSEYLHDVNAYTCRVRFMCCGTAATQIDPGQSSESACTSALDARPAAAERTILAALGNQGARFNLVNAALCIDALKSGRAACGDPDTFNPRSDACTSVVVGTAPIGGGCVNTAMCPLGTYCELTSGPDGGVDGQCVVAGVIGDACGAGSPLCDNIYACGPDGKCIAPLDTGSRCNTPEQCLSQACTGGACGAAPTVRAVYCGP